MIETKPDVSWLRDFAIPALFTLLGAAIGFISSQVRDEWNAKRDKQSFLRAIGMELDALGDQLDASFYEVKGAEERFKEYHSVPQFAFSLRTAVFTGQVAKVRNVDDLLMIEIIHFYSDMGTLSHIFESVNDLAGQFNEADLSSDAIDKIGLALASSLRSLREQTGIFANRLRKLREKLPKAGQPD